MKALRLVEKVSRLQPLLKALNIWNVFQKGQAHPPHLLTTLQPMVLDHVIFIISLLFTFT